jgi:hypothetical protein
MDREPLQTERERIVEAGQIDRLDRGQPCPL